MLMEVMDIGYQHMLLIYGLLLIPLCICYVLKIAVIKEFFTAVVRMSVQLALVALYLGFIFRINSLWVNLLWILFMICIADASILRSSGLRLSRFFPVLFAGIAVGTLLVVGVLVFLAVRPEPLYDARYLIPVTGMVLGNCLRANVISLERFYATIRKNEKEFLTYLLMGATLSEAILPYLREALKAALAPTITTMATLGLVSLPGMMTGQILGGSDPAVAIKYQIAIMIAIFTATVITAAINIGFSLRTSFNRYQVLDKSIFAG